MMVRIPTHYKLDIVGSYVNSSGNSNVDFFWYENDGTENFTEHFIYSGISGTKPIIKVVDLDDDGDLDIVAGAINGWHIYWYKNDGNENFLEVELNYFMQHVKDIHVVDIDQDGDTDIISLQYDEINALINDGSENFTFLQLSDSFCIGSRFDLGDIDGDNDLDVSLVSEGSDEILWFENEGSFIFSKHIIQDLPLGSAFHLTAVDMDQDSDQDIIVTSTGADKLAWFENDGYENFSYHYISESLSNIQNICAADLDLDGDMDVLSASRMPSEIIWHENDGGQNFSEHLIEDTVVSPYSVQCADLNNDGSIDIIGGGYGYLKVYINDGNENFESYHITDANSNTTYRKVLLFDIDTDGDMDVFPSINQSDKVVWFENDGLGNFSLNEFTANLFAGYGDCDVVDLDNDLDFDIIVSPPGGSVRWYENDGSLNFTEHIEPVSSYFNIHADDVDYDGNTDIITNKGLYKADSLQNYTLDNSNPFNEVWKTTSVDVDNDGDLDILSISRFLDELIWHENLLYNRYMKIRVLPFIDENSNGVFDSLDYHFQLGMFETFPQSMFIMSVSDTTTILLDTMGVYTVNLSLDTLLWQATSPTSIQVNVDSEDFYDTIYFGIEPKLDLALNSDISGMWARCFSTNTHTLNVSNFGARIDTGYIEYTLDGSATFDSSTSLPDSIDGQTLFYGFSNLLSSASYVINVNVNMPGNIMTLNHNFKLFADTGQLVMVDYSNWEELVRCSYDPNDKQVFPNYGDSGYVLNDTELEYLIRFQNTGNDTAFVVELIDTLDANLDVSTFRLISTSHDLTSVNINNNRALSFLYEDINLTDTVTNEPESHGFVKFGIKTAENLPLNTSVTNEASIYFDHNPPIVTNSTRNTIYNCGILGNSIELHVDYPNVIVDIEEDYLENAFWVCNGDVLHSGTDGFTFSPTIFGNVDVSVHLENDLCTFDTTYSLYVNNIGIIEDRGQEQISVFPNPTTGRCYVDLGVETNVFKIRISTITGKFLDEYTYNSSRMIELNLPKEKGIYLLEIIKDNGNSEFVKVVKQ